ncbi:hypothetical protein ACFXPT_17975 [Streptomyces goshikiensis]|uniref:hypothetical protein n=1 Tax=Streptomyces goshikiensis TaxID=1942 RepID=UPI0036C77904
MEILQISESERRVFDALIPAGSAKSVKLGTLGPKGTSSEYIAQSMARSIGGRDALRIVLESTYEQCMTALAGGQVDLALVAHAYPKINAFYMNPLLEPAIVFRGNTPEYGLATRPDFEFSGSSVKRSSRTPRPFRCSNTISAAPSGWPPRTRRVRPPATSPTGGTTSPSPTRRRCGSTT